MYCVPSPVVTVQYSPLPSIPLSPSSSLSAPVEWVTVEASSSLRCQAPVVSSLTSSVDLPLRTREALSYFQHSSCLSVWPSSSQEAYERST